MPQAHCLRLTLCLFLSPILPLSLQPARFHLNILGKKGKRTKGMRKHKTNEMIWQVCVRFRVSVLMAVKSAVSGKEKGRGVGFAHKTEIKYTPCKP